MVWNDCVEADQSLGLLVGQVASLAGVTVKAVRHYEKLGLIKHSRREPNGYKRYASETVVRVACVSALRRAGVPLSRVAGVIDDAPTAAESVQGVLDVLRAERDRLDEQVMMLDSLAAAISTGEGLLEELGRPFVEGVSDALGEAGRGVTEDAWRIERRVVGLFASFGVAVDELPEAARDYIRLHADEVAAALEADAALAGLRDVAADDPRVDEVATQLERARPTARSLAQLVELPAIGRTPAGEVFRSKLSAGQLEALRKAGAAR